MPSSGPSSGPTAYPTAYPTSFPTSQPSSIPTSSPSGQPTSQPTQSPKILGINIHYAFITTGLCGVLALIGYAYYRYTRMRRIKRSKSDPPEDDGDLSLIISGAGNILILLLLYFVQLIISVFILSIYRCNETHISNTYCHYQTSINAFILLSLGSLYHGNNTPCFYLQPEN